MGSWNVRSLYRVYMTLIQELEKYKIMIMALQETRWPDKGRILKKSHALYYSGTEGRHEFGISCTQADGGQGHELHSSK